MDKVKLLVRLTERKKMLEEYLNRPGSTLKTIWSKVGKGK